MLDELNHKRLPRFITSANVFTHMKSLDKIFPKIGLPNSTRPVRAKNTTSPKEVEIKRVASIAKILARKKSRLEKSRNTVSRFRYTEFGWRSITRPRSQAWIDNKTKLIALLDHIVPEMATHPERFVRATKNTASLIIPKRFVANGLAINKGDMVAQLRALNRRVREHKIALGNIVNKSAKPLSLRGKKVVFSSVGKDGVWDMATMSMRGIHSCQGWTGSYNNCLIGSIADPYAGIIYLTSKKKTSYGSKMHYRSVVRLVIDPKNKPAILLEQVYPRRMSVADTVQAVAVFKNFIKRSGCKYPVVYAPTRKSYYVIPSSNVAVKAVEGGYGSYRDSGLPYGPVSVADDTLKRLLG